MLTQKQSLNLRRPVHIQPAVPTNTSNHQSSHSITNPPHPMNANNAPHWKSKNYTDPQLRRRAVYLIRNQQKSVKETSEWLGICQRSIRDYIKTHRRTGDVLTDEEIKKKRDPKYKRPHRRHKIDTVCSILIRSLVCEYPQITLEDLKDYCAISGYDLSTTAIHYYLKDVNMTFKVISGVKYTASSPLSCECQSTYPLSFQYHINA